VQAKLSQTDTIPHTHHEKGLSGSPLKNARGPRSARLMCIARSILEGIMKSNRAKRRLPDKTQQGGTARSQNRLIPHARDGQRKFVKGLLSEKFGLIDEHWRPKVVAQLNGQEVKLVKFKGVFPWHHHENADEMFLVWRGEMTIEFRDRRVVLQSGEFCVVPRGVEHRTMADAEAEVVIFEPAETRNTGNVVDQTFTAPNGVTI
jgi:mannose-6-phosphate isomerase-like protein (cupin superfamily)